MAAKREVGKTLTLLLVFLVTVIAIVLIFGYFTNFLHFGTATKDIQTSGVISVQVGGGSGATLAFSVSNLSSTNLVAASFSCPSSQFSSDDCSGLALKVNGLPVSTQNPVEDKQVAGGTATVSAPSGGTFIAGETYTVTITFSFADGTTQTAVELLPAQA